MSAKTRILIVEHDPNDIELIQYELKKENVNYIAEIVETRNTYEAALRNFVPDIILSDYSLPSFDGPAAFEIKEKISPHTPFIFVSGTVGEENSIELIKNGVTDFVLKDKLFTLTTKVNRALKEAKAKEQKLAVEESLLQSETNLRTIFENTDTGFYLLDNEANIISFNKKVNQFAKLSFGFELQEKKNLIKLFAPERQQQFADMLSEIIKGSNFNYEINYPQTDGSFIWYSVHANQVCDSNGKVIGICVSVNDITERKKAEDKISESEEIFRRLFNESADPILLLDDTGFTDCNHSAVSILGYSSSQEVLNKKPWDISPEKQPDGRLSTEKAEAMIAKALQQGYNKFEWVHTKSDGTEFPVEVMLTPIKLKGKQSFYTLWRDIAERKKSELLLKHLNDNLEKKAAELEISNTELEHFAYVASHDLQEPLRMVISFMNLLEKRMDGQLDETNKQYIHFAVDGAKRMKTLIQDLLLYSRVGINKENFTATDLNEVMQYVNHLLEEDIKKNRAVITVKPMPVISVNKTLISQLFVNLVSNASKYHGDKEPEIEVAYAEEPGNWIFYVKDNGIGIDPKFFDKIFIIFQRLHNKSEYSGTGIGLAICKKIVEIHKGKIWVESESGKGSTFYFSIPKQNV